MINLNELSKEISYILRHNPQKKGLKIDENGWVDLNSLILAVKSYKQFNDIELNDILRIVEFSEKKRHEIKDGKIRALYGHSLDKKIVKNSVRPPNILYHGTAKKFINSIFKLGLLPKKRQYVHLSENIKTAFIVGKRRDNDPVVLIINAEEAWNNGVLFYKEESEIWLSDSIPMKYIELDYKKTNSGFKHLLDGRI